MTNSVAPLMAEETRVNIAYVLDQVLILLSDGRWHTEEEISKMIHLSLQETGAILTFLLRFAFIQKDEEGNRAKISPLTEEHWHRL